MEVYVLTGHSGVVLVFKNLADAMAAAQDEIDGQCTAGDPKHISGKVTIPKIIEWSPQPVESPSQWCVDVKACITGFIIDKRVVQ